MHKLNSQKNITKERQKWKEKKINNNNNNRKWNGVNLPGLVTTAR